MDKKTLQELDYYKIRDEIAEFCTSEESAFMFRHLEPFSDEEKINLLKEQSKEWTVFLDSQKSSPFLAWNPIYSVCKQLFTDGAFIPQEKLFDIGMFCKCAIEVKKSVLNANEELNLTHLTNEVSSLPDLTVVFDSIFKILSFDGLIRDLPELRVLRAKIDSLNSRIKGIMQSFVSNQKYADVLESTVPVLRSGRQVLAVKSGRRTAIPGIVHEVSQTGFTSYIEPEEAVKCANDLIETKAALDAEIRKILLELAKTISPYAQDLLEALKKIESLDARFACALWGKKNSCVFAETETETKPLTLLGARHPILAEKAVPIDVKFLPKKRVLIITGPNTGGKTVTLKTIALFAMLNQTGFPLPCKEGSVLPIFSSVYADIGDEQNMEESLSTFGGHMKNIGKAVRSVNEKSLVLLDELGSGTDPQEGAAISMAVLDTLIEKKAFVLITTHQGVIKNYGYTHEECVNASVEFNSDTLSPTYRLLMGIPGESHAIEIAQKNGIPKPIIQKAKEYLVNEKADISSLINGLVKKHAEADERNRSIEETEQKQTEKQLRLEERSLELREKELELKKGIQSESMDFLLETRKKLENLVKELREGELTREKTVGVKTFISDLTAQIQQNEENLIKEEEQLLQEKENFSKEKKRISLKATKKRTKLKDALQNATPVVFDSSKNTEKAKKQNASSAKTFEAGREVIALSSKRKGILSCKSGKGKWEVLFGSLKITMKESELALCSPNSESKTSSFSADYTVDLDSSDKNANKPAFELRLLGLRAEDAKKMLDRQLDLCILNNFKHFSIIHGKGNGILQQMVQDYLSNCPVVSKFMFAPPEDGGFGKTYVELY